LNMRRINSRGMAQANKHVMMAALTYNLKKYLAFERRSAKRPAMAMKKALRGLKFAFLELLWADIIAIPAPSPA
ncbi:hypothetical protein L0U89_20420, partial [Mariniradius sp. RY-2]|nr:hypothetical protein [Mariniradius sediminis]